MEISGQLTFALAMPKVATKATETREPLIFYIKKIHLIFCMIMKF